MFDFLADIFDVFDSSDLLTTLSTVGTIVGTGFEVAGGLKKAKSNQEAAEFNATQLRQNEFFSEEQARDAVYRGEKNVRRARLATRQLIGRQRARIAANNIQVDDGSAVDVQLDAAALGELDALTIRENARREAAGYRQQGANYSSQAALTQKSGDYDPFLTAAPTVITGASTVFDRYLRAR